jgi:DNA-binding SARP family transcriptional activator
LLTDFRIELLGGFRVVIGGRVIEPKAWSQRKPAALVKMLALGPGHRLRREQVMDALWPELDPPAAAANLRKALHSARRSLGADEGTGLILSAGDLLCLPPDGLTVDVDEYWSFAGAARRAGAHALAEAAARFAASFQGSSAWSAMAQSAAASAALADGDLVTARLRFQSAADLYARAGHSFWVDWASTQVKTVSGAT